MAESSEPNRQAGCGLPNLLLPLYLIGGPALGWWLARPCGWEWGLLGCGGGGLVLVVPAVGLTIGAVVLIVMATERLTGRNAGTPPPTDPPGSDEAGEPGTRGGRPHRGGGP